MNKCRIAFLFSLTLVLALAVSGTVLAAGDPVVKDNWKSGDAAFECAQIGEYKYAYKVDEWDQYNGMDGGYTASFEDGHSNIITILNSGGKVFDWNSSPNGIGAVIVKAGTGSNVWFYDPQVKSDTGLYGYQDKDISHATFCWNPDPTEECWEDETAWAAGNRYVTKGNWATYTPYVAGSTVKLYAGQTMEAGTVHFSAAADGKVTITITLNDGWKFADAGENVKIQDYATAPSGNPAPGLFAWKGTATSSSFSIDVPENNFYGVHADLLHSVECPVAEGASLAYGSGSLFLPVVQK